MNRTCPATPPSSQPQTLPDQSPDAPVCAADTVDPERLSASVASSLRIEGFDVAAMTLLEQHEQHRI